MLKTNYTWEGERIDTRLAKEFNYSRNFFHHIIDRWGILVNNKKTKKSYKLKNWDKIEIDDLKRYLSNEILQESPNIEIPIIYEKDDFLIIKKPKWVLTHPVSIRDIHSPSVVWFLYHKFKNLPSVGNFIRAGILHRLDKETDWLMIIAKTEKWLNHFKALFDQKSTSKDIQDKENTKIKKFYKAECEITPKWTEFLESLTTPFIIEELVVPKMPNAIPKIWITKILNFDKSEKTVKFEIEILTWRTHQIRYHLSQKWLPIVGDYLYWNSKTKEKMQLTAYKLIFQDPDWENTTIEI